jgi:hypothetical protein
MQIAWDDEMKALGSLLLEQAPPVRALELVVGEGREWPGGCSLDLDSMSTLRAHRPRRTGRSVVTAAAAVSSLALGLGIAAQLRESTASTSVGGVAPPTSRSPTSTEPTSTPSQNLSWPPRVSLGSTATDWALIHLAEGGTPAAVTDGYAEYRNDSSGAELMILYQFQHTGPTPTHDSMDRVVGSAMLLGHPVDINGAFPLVEPAAGAPLVVDENATVGETVSFLADLEFEGYLLRIVANRSTLVEFVDVIDRIEVISTETWEAQLPHQYVRPADRPAAVDAALEGVPTPQGFDAEPIRSTPAVVDQTDLELEVGTAVACAWIGVWAAATDDGKDAAADQATEALGTAREWRPFRGQGDDLYPLQIIDAISSGTLRVANSALDPIESRTVEVPKTETTTPEPDITTSNAGGWLECPGWAPVGVG